LILPLIWAGAAALVTAAALAPAPGASTAGQGARLYQQCYSCHSLEPGENLPSGPTLYGIVGKRIAGEARFDYSPAFHAFAGRQELWTPELLDRFIADPETVVPGTHMSFHGMADPAQRAALIEYLKGR
jgi:cytochrome c